ncbi:hypothetical protein [Aminipila sp.]|uniref:hypothetical protein n=1 Tax=Aminipila sp. TaxID=2060095 RepID=UPI0028A22280|nr:hypothetical protein [Aminipila sp.]
MYNDIYDKEQFAYMHNTLCKWLKLKIEGKGLSEILKKRDIDTIMIYGIGGLGEYVYDELKNSDIHISYIIDRRYKDFPNGFNGISVIGIKQIPYKFDGYILITPIFYFQDVLNDLMNYGVKMEKVMSLSMLLA